LEACANGTPVVAFDVGGISEWLKDGENGFLVPYLDETAMAEKLDLLAANPDLVQQMGLAGQARVAKEFNEGIYMSRLLAVFEKIL
jgi:glycosyltransferase involved in cell wall biosynthesis